MCTLLNDIKTHQLQARKERDVPRSKILTYFIGEIERSIPPAEVTDEKVVSKLRKVCSSLMDEEEIAILEFYLPKMYDESWHREYVKQGIHAGTFGNIGDMMKLVSIGEKNGTFEKGVDKGLLTKFFKEFS